VHFYWECDDCKNCGPDFANHEHIDVMFFQCQDCEKTVDLKQHMHQKLAERFTNVTTD
jgi:hypothetical protein